jgi:hypothetical protein
MMPSRRLQREPEQPTGLPRLETRALGRGRCCQASRNCPHHAGLPVCAWNETARTKEPKGLVLNSSPFFDRRDYAPIAMLCQ